MVRSLCASALALSYLNSAFAAPATYPNPSQIPIIGPVINQNFPDPCFIEADGTFYAFGTETVNQLPRLHVATSTDFIHWQVQAGRDGLAHLPPWANTTTYRNVWAPDVTRLDDGTYLMYFSALYNGAPEGNHCIGRATSKTPIGPYVPDSEPIVCPQTYSTIDAALFLDWSTGRRYLTWKQETQPGTPLVIQEVTADGSQRIGNGPTTILTNNGAADRNDIEAPNIVKARDDGTYVLFFSPGIFTDGSYSVSYATSRNLFGPYTRKGAIVSTQSSGIRGPGHMYVGPGGQRMVFHGLIDNATPVPNRGMWVAGVSISNGVVTVG